LRARIRWREREQAGGGKSDRDVSTLHLIPPTSDLPGLPGVGHLDWPSRTDPTAAVTLAVFAA